MNTLSSSKGVTVPPFWKMDLGLLNENNYNLSIVLNDKIIKVKDYYINKNNKDKLYLIIFYLYKLNKLKFNYLIYNKEFLIIIKVFKEF